MVIDEGVRICLIRFETLRGLVTDQLSLQRNQQTLNNRCKVYKITLKE